jgi:hypothetical protein
MTTIATGFGLSRATAYRYRREVITVLATQAPDLHDALQQVAEHGWPHIIIDGKLFRTDQITQTATSEKGSTIDAWYSGKHREFGGNAQAVMRPNGHPIWTSPVSPGRHNDMTAARPHLLGALYWAASQPGLEPRARAGVYVRGLLAGLERKNGWTLVGLEWTRWRSRRC